MTTSATVLAGQPVGTRAKVTGIALPPATHQRLLEMGLTVGTECTVVLPSGEEKVLGSGEYTVTAKA